MNLYMDFLVKQSLSSMNLTLIDRIHQKLPILVKKGRSCLTDRTSFALSWEGQRLYVHFKKLSHIFFLSLSSNWMSFHKNHYRPLNNRILELIVLQLALQSKLEAFLSNDPYLSCISAQCMVYFLRSWR